MARSLSLEERLAALRGEPVSTSMEESAPTLAPVPASGLIDAERAMASLSINAGNSDRLVSSQATFHPSTSVPYRDLLPSPTGTASGAGALPQPSHAHAHGHVSYSTLSRIIAARGSSTASGGLGLRTLTLPSKAVDEFAKLAAPNTYAGDRGVETCGVLAGVERGGGLSVTHIILPPQTGQPDDCEVTDDEALLGYCLKHQLTAVGWIHTHPSQDCFLSALDLHTHAGYQSCLPEAIAIVVAPRDARCTMAVFRLTDGDGLGQGGLQLIQACEVGAGSYPVCREPRWSRVASSSGLSPFADLSPSIARSGAVSIRTRQASLFTRAAGTLCSATLPP